MNGHGPTSTTTSRSSSTNWAGISSASNNRTGRSNTCLALQSLPISANTSARHTDAQSGISRSLFSTRRARSNQRRYQMPNINSVG
jgi:hypothetical protein